MGVRGAGSTIKEGELLAKKGTRIQALTMASVATGGVTNVCVYARPKVAFLPTGSELIPLGETLQRGQMIDTNSILMKQLLEENGAQPIIYPITKDEVVSLRNRLEEAVEAADIVIINGGSSKGGEDFNVRLLEELGELLFHGVAIVPGRPMALALIKGKLVMVLPGPALAAFNGMEWCVKALISHMLQAPVLTRETLEVTLTEDVFGPPHMDVLSMMQVARNPQGEYTAKPIPLKGKTVSHAFRAQAYKHVIAGTAPLKAGTKIEVCLLVNKNEIPQE
jgi:molybdopterin molybdotransferase/putative molybdopterin biosynthesis protein